MGIGEWERVSLRRYVLGEEWDEGWSPFSSIYFFWFFLFFPFFFISLEEIHHPYILFLS